MFLAGKTWLCSGGQAMTNRCRPVSALWGKLTAEIKGPLHSNYLLLTRARTWDALIDPNCPILTPKPPIAAQPKI